MGYKLDIFLEILDRQRVTVSNKQVGKPPPASNQSINNDFPTEEEEFDLVPRNTLKQKHSQSKYRKL